MSFGVIQVTEGTFHQNSEVFSERSRGRQCYSMCLADCSAATQKPDLDGILGVGDEIFNDITAGFERPSLLLVQELLCEVKVRGIQYGITRYDPMTGMVGRDPTDSHYYSI